MAPEEPSARAGDQLDGPAGLPVGDRPVQLRQVVPEDLHPVAVSLPGLPLVEPDAGELRLGVDRPRDGRVVHLRAEGEERVPDHGPGLVVGDVGEEGAADHVAGGVDAVPARAEAAVHLDPLAPVEHPRGVEPQPLDVGPSAGGHEELLGRQGPPAPVPGGRPARAPRSSLPAGASRPGAVRARGLHRHPPRPAVPVDRDGPRAGQHPHALLLQDVGERRRELGVLPGQDPVLRLHQRHLHAEPGVGLGELHPHGSGPEDHRRSGEAVAVEGVLVGHVPGLLEPVHGGDGRPAAGGQHHLPGGERPAVGLHVAVGGEPSGRPLQDLDAHLPEPVGVVVGLDRGAGVADAGEDPAAVDRRVAAVEAEVGGLPHRVRDPRRSEEGLARDASRPEALAAQAVPLDERGPGAQRRRSRGGDQARCAPADDDEVVGALG